jgi:hypothetical protein
MKAGEMADHPLVGMWKLVSMERIDNEGNVSEVEVLTGLLVYTPDGWMTEALEYQIPGSERARTHVFYGGTYEIDGDTVIHRPKIHSNHQLAFTELPRHYEIRGNRFTLTAHNPNGAAYLVWEQVMI